MGDVKRQFASPMAAYYVIASASVVLLLLGLAMVLSASSLMLIREGSNPYEMFLRQVMFGAIGGVAAVLLARTDQKRLSRLGPVLLAFSVIGIFLTLVPGLGVTVNGNTNWLALPFFQPQPSEFAKLGLVLGFGWFIAKYGPFRSLLQLMPYLIVVVATLAGVMLEHDMGTAVILTIIVLAQLWVAGVPVRWFAGIGLTVVTLGALAIAMQPYRVDRLKSLMDPFADPLGVGFHVVRSIYALSSGGLTGAGLGSSRQKWGGLPEAHNDFILAVVGEELGLVGTLTVLGLYVVIIWFGIWVASHAADAFCRYAALGVTAWIGCQALINMAVAIGVFPVMGVPLPLLSYGGSSVLATLMGIGVLLSCARQVGLQVARAQAAAAGEATAEADARSTGSAGRPLEMQSAGKADLDS